MNNITQIYKNTIKNAIKLKMSNLTDTLVDAVVDSIGYNDNTNYMSVVSALQEKERESICMIIKNTFARLRYCSIAFLNIFMNWSSRLTGSGNS